MSSAIKCNNCGSTDIEEDNARGDRVCTNCGSVLEDSCIVSEVQFEESNGGAAAIGQFVSAESSGGATNIGFGKFQVGSGVESREITIKKAKKEITHLCNQLQLTTHYIETAVNFFKMALMRHLTRGRKSALIYAACVYITCRTEGTSHLLIDISDVQQICSYELGRTYLKLSTELCINIPSVDPCLYILRFANRLQFGAKTHEVSMTALRIVQRMKKDSLHSGRRPTGLCGAALLIAARMHGYSRFITDIVRVVKIHESTLRKRLIEFADTPSSSLTLEEFMSVDLEAEHDPPAYTAARIKDRDRILNMAENELNDLQKIIDKELEKDLLKLNKTVVRRYGAISANSENQVDDPDNPDEVLDTDDTDQLIDDMNLEAVRDCLKKKHTFEPPPVIHGLRPDIEKMCFPVSINHSNLNGPFYENCENGELQIDDLDENEINSYVLTEEEAVYKDSLWNSLNQEYLKEYKERQERLAKEKEEGKPEKKKRKARKRTIGPSLTAGEAIEKMCQEKKISSKINYDILKALTNPTASLDANGQKETNNQDVEGDRAEKNAKNECKQEDEAKSDPKDPYLLPIIEETSPIKRKSRKIQPTLLPPTKIHRQDKNFHYNFVSPTKKTPPEKERNSLKEIRRAEKVKPNLVSSAISRNGRNKKNESKTSEAEIEKEFETEPVMEPEDEPTTEHELEDEHNVEQEVEEEVEQEVEYVVETEDEPGSNANAKSSESVEIIIEDDDGDYEVDMIDDENDHDTEPEYSSLKDLLNNGPDEDDYYYDDDY